MIRRDASTPAAWLQRSLPQASLANSSLLCIGTEYAKGPLALVATCLVPGALAAVRCIVGRLLSAAKLRVTFRGQHTCPPRGAVIMPNLG